LDVGAEEGRERMVRFRRQAETATLGARARGP
jgi:hypothetical protein